MQSDDLELITLKNCSVCLDKGEPDKLSGDKGHLLIKCSKCQVCVHSRCLGEARQVDSDFECDKCLYKETTANCIICRGKQGLMQRLEKSVYVHTLCALFCDYFECSNFMTIKIIPLVELEPLLKMLNNKSKARPECILCNSGQGVVLDCECENSCTNKVHFYCALKDKMMKLNDDPDAFDFWQIEWKLISNFSDNEVQTEGQGTNVYSQVISIDAPNTKKQNTKKNKKSDIDAEYKLNRSIHTRGGVLKILCPSHRDKISYCICRRASGSEFMLCCDNCETWFHGRCVGFTNKGINTLKKWYCSYCTEWINNRNNFLLREATEENNQDLIKQAKEKNWKQQVIHNHINYRVIDLIFIAILYTRKADVLLTHPCSIELLYKHYKLGYQIPFYLGTVVNKLQKKHEKFLINENQNEEDFKKIVELKKLFLIENTPPLVEIKEDEELNCKIFTVRNDNVESLRENYRTVERIYNKCTQISDCIVDDSIEILLKSFKWGLDAFDMICDKEVNLADVRSILSVYNEIFNCNENSCVSKPFNNEFEIINQYITNYLAWQKNTKDMLNDHMKRKKEVEKSSKEIDAVIKKDENSSSLNNKINAVIKRKEKAENNLKCKITQNEIEENIKVGKNLKINVNKELDSIESCLKEALDWNEAFIKCKNNKSSVSEFEKLIDDLENILVSTPYMYEAIDLISSLKLFETKADFYIKNQNNLTISTFTEITILTSNELQSCDTILMSKMNILLAIVERVNSTKENVKFHLNVVSEIPRLKKLKEILEKDNKLYKKELEKIDQKIFYLQNLENLLGTKNNLSSLENIEKLMVEYNINDENFKELILSKKLIINKIKSELKFHLDSESMPSEDECNLILLQLQENKLNIEEEEIISNYLYIYQCWKSFSNSEEYSEEQLINFIDKIKSFENIIKGEMEIFYQKLYFMLWEKKTSRIVSVISSEFLAQEPIEINEIYNLKDQFNLRKFNEEKFDKLNNILIEFCFKFQKCQEKYELLLNMVHKDNLKSIEQCKEYLGSLTESFKNFNSKIKMEEKLNKLNEISLMINISEKLNVVIISNQKPDIENIKKLINDCELQIAKNTSFNFQLKQLHSYQLLKNEIDKFDTWMDKYFQYISHKRNNHTEKIDLSLLEILTEEAKKLIINVETEVDLLKKDLKENKMWIESAKKLVDISDNFNNIDLILNNQEYSDTLKQLINEITIISITDTDLIDTIKCLEWACRARSLLNTLGPLNYRITYRTWQEASSLKHFPEIKKKEFYTMLMQQVTLAKNIKDICEILKNYSTKQISEEQFDKIVKEFLTKCIIELSEEKETVEMFLKNKLDIQKKFDSMVEIQSSITDWEKLFVELKKYPIKLTKLLENVDIIITDGRVLQKEVKKIIEQFKLGKITLTKDKVLPLYEKLKISKVTFLEGENLIKMFESSVDSLNKIKLSLQSSVTQLELFELISLIDNIEIHNFTDEKVLKKDLWIKKYEIFISSKNGLISINTIKNLHSECKQLGLVETEQEKWKNLSLLLATAEEISNNISMTLNLEALSQIKTLAETKKLDISDEITEHEIRLIMNKSQVQRNINQHTMIGNKRKNEDILPTNSITAKKNNYRESESESDSESHISNSQINKTINSNSIAATRSRRNISIKIDKDYLYDKDFIENFAGKNINKTTIDEKAKDCVLLGLEETKNNPNLNNINILINDSTSPLINNPEIIKKAKDNLNKSSNTNNIDTYRKQALSHFEKILLENPMILREGKEFIMKQATELEEELFKTHKTIISEYKKGMNNMTQTVKELEKYKKVSALITKNKLNLTKVAKFPYGNKYFDKLKKIEDGQIKVNKSTTQIKNQITETNLSEMIQDMDKLYSSISKPEKLIDIKAVKPLLIPDIDIEKEDGNDSLKSLSDGDDIKFSPSEVAKRDKNEKQSINYNLMNNTNMLLTTKSSSVQSPSSQLNKDSSIPFYTIDMINIIGKNYNPFELYDEDVRENKEENNLTHNTSEPLVLNTKPSKKKKLLPAPIFYDPTKKSEKIVQSVVKLNTKTHKPTLQIWKGNLHISKLIDISKILFCSTHCSDEFSNIQVFPEVLQISSKAKTREVVPYIEKYLVNKSKPVISGWLEIDSESNISAYNKLVEEYDRNDRSGFLMLNGEKVYLFALTNRYGKFYKKMKNEIKIHHKSLMNKIEKLLVFVIIKKVEEDVKELESEHISFIQPIVLHENTLNTDTISSVNNSNNSNKLLNANNNSDVNSMNINTETKPNMSPITSEEEDNSEDADKESKYKPDRLMELLLSDNIEMLEEYVNMQFANLGQDDIIEKLMALDEQSRNKLLNLVVQYQQRVSNNANNSNNCKIESGNTENSEEDVSMNDVSDYQDGENVNMTQDNEDIKNYEKINITSQQENEMDISLTNTSYRVNENLSYLGFSGVNTDILKGEILKSQYPTQGSRNIINEDQLKLLSITNQNNQQMNPMNNLTNMGTGYGTPIINMNPYLLNPMRPMMMHPNYLMPNNFTIDNTNINAINPNQNSNINPNMLPYGYQQRKNTKFSK